MGAVDAGKSRTRRWRKPWKPVTYARAVRKIANWPEYVAQPRQPGKSVVYTMRGGARYYVPWQLFHVFQEVIVNEVYGLARLTPRLGESPVVVDIGANAGYFTLFVTETIPSAEVWAYEPLPGNFAVLKKNHDMNPSVAHQIHVFQQAVTGKHVEAVQMFRQVGKIETAIASTFSEWLRGEKSSVAVPAVTLAEIIESHAPREIDLLKVDCEGSEYDILFGTPPELLAHVRRIGMEVHTRPCLGASCMDMLAFLHEQGYTTNVAVDRKGKNSLVWAWR